MTDTPILYWMFNGIRNFSNLLKKSHFPYSVTDGQTDTVNYREALLLKSKKYVISKATLQCNVNMMFESLTVEVLLNYVLLNDYKLAGTSLKQW